METSYFMGIDTGTNSSKGVLIDDKGNIIAEHSTEHFMTNPAPGHYEHDADKDYIVADHVHSFHDFNFLKIIPFAVGGCRQGIDTPCDLDFCSVVNENQFSVVHIRVRRFALSNALNLRQGIIGGASV